MTSGSASAAPHQAILSNHAWYVVPLLSNHAWHAILRGGLGRVVVSERVKRLPCVVLVSLSLRAFLHSKYPAKVQVIPRGN